MSLTACIAKSLESTKGPQLAPEDVQMLPQIAAENVAKGMSQAKAELAAVDTMLELAEAAHEYLTDQLRAAGIKNTAWREFGYTPETASEEAMKAVAGVGVEEVGEVRPESQVPEGVDENETFNPGMTNDRRMEEILAAAEKDEVAKKAEAAAVEAVEAAKHKPINVENVRMTPREARRAALAGKIKMSAEKDATRKKGKISLKPKKAVAPTRVDEGAPKPLKGRVTRWSEGGDRTSVDQRRGQLTDKLSAFIDDEIAPWEFMDAHNMLAYLRDGLHDNDFYKRLTEVLLRLGITDVSVEIASAEDLAARDMPHATTGYYQPRRLAGNSNYTRLITLNENTLYTEDFLPTLLHELVHAVTMPALEQDNLVAAQLDELRGYAAEYLGSRNLIEPSDMLHDVYGLTSLPEFLSEALANSEFQNVLARIPYKGSGKQSVLSRLFDVIRNYLGLKPRDGTLLEEVLALTPDLFVDQKKALARLKSKRAMPAPYVSKDFPEVTKRIDVLKAQKKWYGPAQGGARGTVSARLAAGVNPAAALSITNAADYVFDTSGGAMDLRRMGQWGFRASLGWHTTDQIVRRFKGALEYLERYQTNLRKKTQIAREQQHKAEQINKLWRDLEKASPARAVETSKLMHDATLWDAHPDLAFYDPMNKHLPDTQQMRDTHKSLQARFNALGGDGRLVYRRVRNYFADQRNELRWASLTHLADVQGGESVLGKTLYGDIQLAKSTTDIEALDLSAVEDPEGFKSALRQVVSVTSVPGPYFPLRRFGDYVVEASKKAIKYPQIYQTRKEAWKAARDLRKDPTVKVTTRSVTGNKGGPYQNERLERSVEMFESLTEANRRAEELSAQGYNTRNKPNVVVSKKIDWTMPPGSQGQVLLAQASRKLGQDTAEFKAINTAFIELMVENSMRKSDLPRRKIKGASVDMRRAFAERAYAGSWALADIETSMKSSEVTKGLREGAQGDVRLGDVVAELTLRDNKGLEERRVSAVDRVLSKTGFIWYLASPSYTMVNLSQVPLVAMPYLSGKFGTSKAAVAVFEAYGRLTKAAAKELASTKFGWSGTAENVIDVLKAQLDIGARDMVETLTNRGIIDATFVQELYETSRGVSPGKVGEVANRVMDIARTAPQTAEILNRVVVASAAYKLARDKGSTQEAAIEAASEAVLITQFDYSDMNKPRNFKRFPGARALMMFKMYAQGMYALLAMNSVKGLNLKNTQEAKEARKILGGLIFTHSMAAGVLGGVFMEPVRVLIWVAEKMFEDEDEPWDLDDAVTQFIYDLTGSVAAAEVITRGLPRSIGFDMAGRVGLDNLAFMGLEEGRTSSDTFWNIVEAAGGPMLAVGHNMFRGADYLSKGEYLKAVQNMTPKFIRDGLKTVGLAKDGLVDFNGNEIANPSKFNGADYLMQVMGFTPGEVTRTYEGRRAQTNAEVKLRDRSKKLKQQWRRMEPKDRIAFFRDEIAPFNRAHPESAITITALRESLRQQKRREAGTKAGRYTDVEEIKRISKAYGG
jgi:hypothetical protein